MVITPVTPVLPSSDSNILDQNLCSFLFKLLYQFDSLSCPKCVSHSRQMGSFGEQRILLLLPDPPGAPGQGAGATGLSTHSLVLEVLHHILHALQLRLQPAPLSSQTLQLAPQVSDVGFKHGLQVGPGGFVVLQQAPFGL